ncbi:MAG: Gfo/Idh/MocA family oxidoreductase [Verrucomicrobiota bacterium]
MQPPDTSPLPPHEPASNVTRKPRVGFLGVGWIGTQRMEAIVKSGLVEVVAVADPQPKAVERAAEIAPDAKRMNTFEELLAEGPDGIVIATPSALHAGQSVTALERGVAVFCQKPLGRTADEVQLTVDAARSADVLLGVDRSYRFTAGMERIRKLISQGELGNIYAANLVFHNAYGPDKPWFFHPELSGGGCVMDLGIHLVDLALWILDSQVVEVSSRLFRHGVPLNSARTVVEDFAVARLDFASGATAQIACSWNLNAGRDAIIEAAFYGDRAGAMMHNVDGSFYNFETECFHGTARQTIAAPPEDWGGRAAVGWARRLAAGEGFDPEIARLVDVAAVLDSIYESC